MRRQLGWAAAGSRSRVHWSGAVPIPAAHKRKTIQTPLISDVPCAAEEVLKDFLSVALHTSGRQQRRRAGAPAPPLWDFLPSPLEVFQSGNARTALVVVYVIIMLAFTGAVVYASVLLVSAMCQTAMRGVGASELGQLVTYVLAGGGAHALWTKAGMPEGTTGGAGGEQEGGRRMPRTGGRFAMQ